jgi:hypothetical protein
MYLDLTPQNFHSPRHFTVIRRAHTKVPKFIMKNHSAHDTSHFTQKKRIQLLYQWLAAHQSTDPDSDNDYLWQFPSDFVRSQHTRTQFSKTARAKKKFNFTTHRR